MKLRVINLEADVFLGVYDWEKEKSRKVVINLWVDYDAVHAVQTDSLEHAINYETLEQRVLEVAKSRHFNLIESLVEEVGRAVLAFPQVAEARVEIAKPGALKHAESVSVEGVYRR